MNDYRRVADCSLKDLEEALALAKERESKRESSAQIIDSIVTGAFREEAVSIFTGEEGHYYSIPIPQTNIYIGGYLCLEWVNEEDRHKVWCNPNSASLHYESGTTVYEKTIVDFLSGNSVEQVITALMKLKVIKESADLIAIPFQKNIDDFSKKIDALAKSNGIDANTIWDALGDRSPLDGIL